MMNNYLINGSLWKDTNGMEIHAHGGHIIFFNDTYYWYGENRLEDIYVSVYSSKDLVNWKFENNVLTTHSKIAPHRVRTNLSLINERGNKINIERPKVIYNKQIKKFVMWMHVENGIDYGKATCAIAIADSPTSEFIYLGSFNPFGFMSRDCTLFVDDDDSAYFISSSRDNADLHIYRLSDDYLNVDKLVNILWQGEYREAPAMVKYNNIYYLLTSYCTGWEPNQCKYGTATNIAGAWSSLKNIGNETTFNTQPAFILTTSNNDIYYFSDRWNGENYFASSYVVLPLEFSDSHTPHIIYQDNFSPF